MADGTAAIAVKRRVMVSGEQLVDAKQSFDQDGRPVVVDHVQRRRRRAASAGSPRRTSTSRSRSSSTTRCCRRPNINEPILGGQAQISGNFTVESANQLAIALASGKLPVKLNVIEERTVSAELGKDSIQKGAIAIVVATLAVILFMLITYGRFGVYATARADRERVDDPRHHGDVQRHADLARHRRLRADDRRGGRRQRADQRAHPRGAAARAARSSTRSRPATRKPRPAIFDANITNVIAAALMFYFGSGPIRGFAVVLMIGIITSVFTAVNFTRMLVALWVKRKRPARAAHLTGIEQ